MLRGGPVVRLTKAAPLDAIDIQRRPTRLIKDVGSVRNEPAFDNVTMKPAADLWR
jgi:hypothetical protein